jgi:antirestriction protein ArdC
MPPFGSFREPAGYYAVRGHETTHWSGAPSRLGRDLRARFGSEAYAMEELVAELGAAFLCATLGVSNTPRPDHAAYLANWLTVLRRDKRAIFAAASQAQKAVDWMTERATPRGELAA